MDPTNDDLLRALANGPVPKPGQTVAQPNVVGGIQQMPWQAANFVGDVTGVNDAVKALRGQMTPEEQMTFAAGAIPALIGGPEAKAAEEAVGAAAPAIAKGIRAYHGSPYDFNQFDLSKIGTGEGAQAYGHGLYFAENPAVAKEYRDALSRPPLTGNDANDLAQFAYSASRGDMQGAIDRLQADVDRYDQKGWPHTDAGMNENYKKQYVEAIQQLKDQNIVRPGKTYEVNINADPEHFLDWDKPLSEQHPVVQDALNKIGGPATTMLPDAVTQGRNGKWYTMRGDQVVGRYDGWPDADTANEAMRVMKQNAVPNYTFGEWQKKMNVPFPEEKLAELGIPGIKYLDQGSRNTIVAPSIVKGDNGFMIAEQGRVKPSSPGPFNSQQEAQDWIDKTQSKQTKNYVVFNDKLIDLIRKYGIAGMAGAGGAAAQFPQPPNAQTNQ